MLQGTWDSTSLDKEPSPLAATITLVILCMFFWRLVAIALCWKYGYKEMDIEYNLILFTLNIREIRNILLQPVEQIQRCKYKPLDPTAPFFLFIPSILIALFSRPLCTDSTIHGFNTHMDYLRRQKVVTDLSFMMNSWWLGNSLELYSLICLRESLVRI